MWAWHNVGLVSEGKSIWEPVHCPDREENKTVIFDSVWAALGWHSLRRAADAITPLPELVSRLRGLGLLFLLDSFS